MTGIFPRQFIHAGLLDSALSAKRPFMVAAMCSANYEDRAYRLAASCRNVNVPFAIYRVPTVHRSISPRGGTDDAYTKSNFIRFVLDEYDRPILYIDADCVLASYPALIDEIIRDGYDFAIYNWLADEHTDCFMPVEVRGPSGAIDRRRYYGFSHAIDHYTQDQLICSGAVQFYSNTESAKRLLSYWSKTISTFPGSADDPCMDFAFNNFAEEAKVTAKWLPKAYARYAWWIYAQPVIDHPDFPNSGGFVEISESEGRRRFYPERMEVRQAARQFPRDAVIDTLEGFILRPINGVLQPVGKTDQNFWLAP